MDPARRVGPRLIDVSDFLSEDEDGFLDARIVFDCDACSWCATENAERHCQSTIAAHRQSDLRRSGPPARKSVRVPKHLSQRLSSIEAGRRSQRSTEDPVRAAGQGHASIFHDDRRPAAQQTVRAVVVAGVSPGTAAIAVRTAW